jgi:uncharacterized protein
MKKKFFLLIVNYLLMSHLSIFGQVRLLKDVKTLMRDGVELSSDIYLPEKESKYPVILVRTPYLKTEQALDHPGHGKFFAENGYVWIVQDVRGRGESDGEFNFWFSEGEDGYDMIEWIAKQEWCNGKVGTMGVSYLGEAQWQAAKKQPPHLVCMASTAPGGAYFNDLPYMGGAFLTMWALHWLNFVTATNESPMIKNADWEKVFNHRPLITMDSVMGKEMRLYKEFLSHPTLDDYWKPLLFSDDDYKNIDIPVLHVTGWFDGMQAGFNVHWKGMVENSPAKNNQYALIGPWEHMQTYVGGSTQMGEMKFTEDAVIDMKEYHLKFFNKFLKESESELNWPKVKLYITGANEWKSFEQYPPKQTVNTPFYFHSNGKANSLNGNGKLSWEMPTKETIDTFTYNPKQPVPIDNNAFAVDSREVAKRNDVLVYTSSPFEVPVEIIGNVSVNLYASSDAFDTDFTARILEVYADGMAINLGAYEFGGIKRARYRNGYDKEELLTPYKPELFEIKLIGLGHQFKVGNCIRIEVSSSIAPFCNPNQNTGNPVATDTEWKIAHQTIYHDKKRPSHVLLPILVK